MFARGGLFPAHFWTGPVWVQFFPGRFGGLPAASGIGPAVPCTCPPVHCFSWPGRYRSGWVGGLATLIVSGSFRCWYGRAGCLSGGFGGGRVCGWLFGRFGDRLARLGMFRLGW